MLQKQLELLKLLLDATRNGGAVWKRDDSASHQTELAGFRCSLRFKYPVLAGNDGSDADAVEVTAGQTVWTFYCGTEGFDLVDKILTAAYPEILEHNQQVSARLEETIEKLRKSAG